jgi:acyl dehydratase
MRSFKSIDEMKAALGEELGPSNWVAIDQPRIAAFAEVTGDNQWIHVDVERAASEMPEGRTIAHGFLTLSLIPHLRHQIWHLECTERGINYGLEKVRFPAPVMSGDRVRLHQTLTSLEPSGEGFKLVFRCTLEIEGRDKPACVADTVSIVYERT